MSVTLYPNAAKYRDGNGDLQPFPAVTGDDGVSPGVTVTAISGGHRVIITDAEHPLGQSFDVLDGDDYVLTAQDKSDIAALVLAALPTAVGVSF